MAFTAWSEVTMGWTIGAAIGSDCDRATDRQPTRDGEAELVDPSTALSLDRLDRADGQEIGYWSFEPYQRHPCANAELEDINRGLDA
jgi:hypothetical protein